MLKDKSMFVCLVMLLACSKSIAGEIAGGELPGSGVLRDHGREVVYGNVIGEKQGFDRSLISVKGSPALKVSARYDYYYTLMARQGGVVIDCGYVDVRNSYNGARASAGCAGST